jgi:adenosylcobinamide-phosphate guanylyltransferase
MAVTALVMAGGKGKRMTLPQEKPLLTVGGKPVVDWVLAALKNAKLIDSIVVAVSPNTPETTKHLQQLGVTLLETPGKEYVSDMDFAVKTLELKTVLAVAADLPFLTGEIVDTIMKYYFACRKPALAIAVPQKIREKVGLGAGYTFDWLGQCLVYAGINVLDGAKIDDAEIEQEIYVLNQVEVAVNINSVDELRIAQGLFAFFSKKN